jgi:hypothetical protein
MTYRIIDPRWIIEKEANEFIQVESLLSLDGAGARESFHGSGP